MKLKSESEVAQSCLTLSDPMGPPATPGSSIHGIFQARVLEWGAIGAENVPNLGWKLGIQGHEAKKTPNYLQRYLL